MHPGNEPSRWTSLTKIRSLLPWISSEVSNSTEQSTDEQTELPLLDTFRKQSLQESGRRRSLKRSATRTQSLNVGQPLQSGNPASKQTTQNLPSELPDRNIDSNVVSPQLCESRVEVATILDPSRDARLPTAEEGNQRVIHKPLPRQITRLTSRRQSLRQRAQSLIQSFQIDLLSGL